MCTQSVNDNAQCCGVLVFKKLLQMFPMNPKAFFQKNNQVVRLTGFFTVIGKMKKVI